MHVSKTLVFTMNSACFLPKTEPKHIFVQKHQFLQLIMHTFSKTSVFTIKTSPFPNLLSWLLPGEPGEPRRDFQAAGFKASRLQSSRVEGLMTGFSLINWGGVAGAPMLSGGFSIVLIAGCVPWHKKLFIIGPRLINRHPYP